MDAVAAAAEAIEAGEVIVYPTETVYGLGADAFSPSAIERIYTLKGRDRDKPLSVAIPSIASLDHVARPSSATRKFIDRFLPGPVTVICRRQPSLPSIVTAGSDRVGIRIPDHPIATTLLTQTGPLSATSANRSGHESVRTIEQLDPAIASGASVVLDGGTTQGTASTVVDVDREIIHRRGESVAAVEAWFETD